MLTQSVLLHGCKRALPPRQQCPICKRRAVFSERNHQSQVFMTLRCIVPMSSILVLVDRVLSLLLEPILDSLLPITPGVFVGGRRFTQALDIGHADALIIEKGLDNESNAAVAQADIRSYFDDLPIWKITRWLMNRGCPVPLLAATLRFQILSKLVLYVGCSQALAKRRSSGGLTGSNVALLISRVPVESTMLELELNIRPLALDVGIGQLCCASYIDNLYTASTGVSGATTSMELILAHLRDVWGLQVKSGSKHVIACKNCSDMHTIGSGWCHDEVAEILGWLIQSNSGTHVALVALQAKLWRCF